MTWQFSFVEKSNKNSTKSLQNFVKSRRLFMKKPKHEHHKEYCSFIISHFYTGYTWPNYWDLRKNSPQKKCSDSTIMHWYTTPLNSSGSCLCLHPTPKTRRDHSTHWRHQVLPHQTTMLTMLNAFIRLQVKCEATKESGLKKIQRKNAVSWHAYVLTNEIDTDTIIPFEVIEKQPDVYQAHLEQIADFIMMGLWEETKNGIKLYDVTNTNEKFPPLHHYRSSNMFMEYR